MKDADIRAGCSESVIDVPLFTELYGYGPFLGRRNRGVLHPLYCRCASFFDGETRVLIIGNDLVTMDLERTRKIRETLHQKTGVAPGNIMVCGSHTHSGPTVSPGIGWGELNPDFAAGWMEKAVETAVKAVKDETPVFLRGGKAPLLEKIGVNRVWEDGATDPEIRWAGFYSGDGGLKLLIHNHGMHGVAFGRILYVSSDWPGAVNASITQGLARHSLYLYGAAGDINTFKISSKCEEGSKIILKIKDVYMKSLEKGLSEGVEFSGAPVKAVNREIELPTEDFSPEQLKKAASGARGAGNGYLADRMEEMAILLEAGADTGVRTDCQVLRIGDLFIYAFGGEPFYQIGRSVIDRSPGRHAMVAAISNSNLRYIPPPEVFAANPDIVSGDGGYGYYSVYHSSLARLKNKYRPDIGPFLIDFYLKMAGEIC